jgi:hypothetical protein
MSGRDSAQHGLGRVALIAAAVGALALAAWLAVGWLAGAEIMPAYLAGLLCWATIPVGALGLLLTYQLVGGDWGLVLGEVTTAACRTLPLITLLVLPILIFQADIFPWHRPEVLAEPRVAAKAGYLAPTAFTLRAVAYLVIWVGLSARLAWDDDALRRLPRRRATAAVGAILYTLSVTFAAVDWAMSLEPKFASSAYGWIFLTDALVVATAFAIVVVAAMGRTGGAANPFGDGETKVLSGILLGGILFWTYIVFMQYLVIWSGNLPDPTHWYQARAGGGWTPVIWTIGLLHVAIPFFILLSPRARASWMILTAVAAVVLVMRFVHMIWLILPAFGPAGWLQALLVACAIAGIGGLWLALFLWTLPAGRRHPAVAAEHPHHR